MSQKRLDIFIILASISIVLDVYAVLNLILNSSINHTQRNIIFTKVKTKKKNIYTHNRAVHRPTYYNIPAIRNSVKKLWIKGKKIV